MKPLLIRKATHFLSKKNNSSYEKKTHLISLISSLTKKEILEIRRFLNSPFYNKRQDVKDLFEYLIFINQKKRPIPSKKETFTKLFGEKTSFDDHQLRMVISFLLKLIEKYLIQANLLKDEVKVKATLAEIYRQRSLDKHFEKSIKEAEEKNEKQVLRSKDYFTNSFQIENEKYQFFSANKRTSESNLQVVSNNLDLLYFAQKLQQACLLLSHQKMYNAEYQLGLLPEILEYIEKNELTNIPAIAAYYYSYQLLANDVAPVAFAKLLDLVLKNNEKFPKEEVRGLYLLAINYCIRRYNKGDKKVLVDNFTLYQEGLKHGYLLTNNQLSHFTYRNIVTFGLIRKEHDWLERFIFDYKKHLDEKQRETTFNFSLARLKYARKEYHEALDLLQNVDFSEPLPSLASRTIILKIFYSLEEYDLLNAHIDAMKVFIRRKKNLGYHNKNYLNMICFVKKKIELADYEKEKLLKLKEEILETQAVAEKEWLLGIF